MWPCQLPLVSKETTACNCIIYSGIVRFPCDSTVLVYNISIHQFSFQLQVCLINSVHELSANESVRLQWPVGRVNEAKRSSMNRRSASDSPAEWLQYWHYHTNNRYTDNTHHTTHNMQIERYILQLHTKCSFRRTTWDALNRAGSEWKLDVEWPETACVGTNSTATKLRKLKSLWLFVHK